MILIIGQAFVNLSPGQVWKAPHNIIDAGTVDDQTDHVVHPNPSALHNRIAPADICHIDQVTVTSRWHAFMLVRQANLEKAILEAVRPSAFGAERILERVSEHFQSDLETLKERGIRDNLARRCAITLCWDHAGLSHDEIAALFCMPSSNSVAQTIRRTKAHDAQTLKSF
jgi:hypothetical protein